MLDHVVVLGGYEQFVVPLAGLAAAVPNLEVGFVPLDPYLLRQQQLLLPRSPVLSENLTQLLFPIGVVADPYPVTKFAPALLLVEDGD